MTLIGNVITFLTFLGLPDMMDDINIIKLQLGAGRFDRYGGWRVASEWQYRSRYHSSHYSTCRFFFECNK